MEYYSLRKLLVKSRILLLLVVVFSFFVGNAQVVESEAIIARNLVSTNKEAIGLSSENLNNYIISSTYDNMHAGYRMVYLQQSYKGIPVYNQMLVLAFKNGRLVSKAGAFLSDFEKLANVKSGIPQLSAESAAQAAISDRGLPAANRPATVINNSAAGDFVEFTDMGVSRKNITAQLIWAPVENSQEFHVAWQVYIIPKTTSDYWMVRVDAVNSKVIGVDNYTNYDHWDHPETGGETSQHSEISLQSKSRYNRLFYFNDNNKNTAAVTTASYRVVPFPAEAPSFPLGSHALIPDPWLAALGNATTLKWNTGASGVDYNYTRGNNVWAYQDQAPDNTGTIAESASSTTALPILTFNFTPDYTVAPTQSTTVKNQQFNITNLFYWNNIVHDVMYQYGFTEAAGNFQDDNLFRGGDGNDHVNAEAQDDGGVNNATFSTPVDGLSGTMQMFLFTGNTPYKDGDVDNGIIVHEYGHGISNRLTGGPANSSCLSNAEQMGEGWSDYYALMFTQDWATATLSTGFTTPRGLGTYVLSQPTTGPGIRTQKYCTDFSINNRVYSNPLPGTNFQYDPVNVHNRGEIWCATLWDMTWCIINLVGVINPNLYDLAGGGGNNIAMNLVTEGLKLQPCSPGFISGRDAILQADQLLYGGAYSCCIWEAFRRRGMGPGASEGSTNSVTDQVPSFNLFTLTSAAGTNAQTVFNSAITNITYSYPVTATAIISWSPLPPVGVIVTPGSGLLTISGTPPSAPSPFTYTYTITSPQFPCFSVTGTITVSDKPIVTCPSNLTVCVLADPFILSGATPTGGIYSGDGVMAGILFNPALVTIGTHTITYTYTDPPTQISNSCTFTITVGLSPTLGAYPNTTLVAGTNTKVMPDAAPSNTLRTVAYSNTDFTGTFAVDPVTGVVTVTDAK